MVSCWLRGVDLRWRGELRPTVTFAVACCYLVVEKMRIFVVDNVPECTEKKNCLSGDRSFFVKKFSACTHRSRECM